MAVTKEYNPNESIEKQPGCEDKGEESLAEILEE